MRFCIRIPHGALDGGIAAYNMPLTACRIPYTDTVCKESPANTKRSANVGTMLGQRRRRWGNFVPALAERFVFAGSCLCNVL